MVARCTTGDSFRCYYCYCYICYKRKEMNIKRLLSRVLRYYLIKKLRRGMSVSIFPSWGCNYKCDYCLLRTDGIFPEGEMLSLDSWKGFLNDLDTCYRNSEGRGIKEICLLGGEPTLLPYFTDLCHWILFEKRWMLMIYTNMSNLKTLEIKPSMLLRIEATYHYQHNHIKYHERYKKVNKIHRVIPRQLMPKPSDPMSKVIPILSYAHKDFIEIESKNRDLACPPRIRIAPNQAIHMIYGNMCKEKSN